MLFCCILSFTDMLAYFYEVVDIVLVTRYLHASVLHVHNGDFFLFKCFIFVFFFFFCNLFSFLTKSLLCCVFIALLASMAMGPTLQTTTSVSTGQIDQNSMQRAYQALGIPYNGKNQTRPPGMPQAISKFRSTLSSQHKLWRLYFQNDQAPQGFM